MAPSVMPASLISNRFASVVDEKVRYSIICPSDFKPSRNARMISRSSAYVALFFSQISKHFSKSTSSKLPKSV